MAKSTSFHVSNYGSFGGNLPRDMDGYCHLTARAWLAAPMDAMGDRMTRERAAELARESREAVKAADAALAKWRSS